MKHLEDNTYCNIIEDLLPLYIENLVSAETKEEIETHLKTCTKCTQVLKDMENKNIFDIKENKEICEKNNKEETDKEIKCIKKIKKRIFLKILLAIIITFVVAIFALDLWNTYRIILDENGKWTLHNFNTGSITKGMDYTNVILQYEIPKMNSNIELQDNTINLQDSSKKGEINNVVLTFNKNNICVNARIIITGYTEEEIKKKATWYSESSSYSNIEVKNGKLYMNCNRYVGKEREKLINNFIKDYNAKVVEF